MCCCGVLYALTPPRGSASPPLSLSTSQDLRPPPRESISQENCPPPPPQPSTSTPSPKVIHSLSVDTSCCLLRPGFGFGGGTVDCPIFPPKISAKIHRVWEISPRKVPRRAGGRPSRPSRSTATATTGDPSRSATSARIGSRTRHLARGRPGARFPDVFRHVDGGGGV